MSNMIVATSSFDQRVFLFKDNKFSISGAPNSNIWDRFGDIRYMMYRPLPSRAEKYLLVTNDLPEGIEWDALETLPTEEVTRTPLGYVRTKRQKDIANEVYSAAEALNITLRNGAMAGMTFDIHRHFYSSEAVSGVERQAIEVEIKGCR